MNARLFAAVLAVCLCSAACLERIPLHRRPTSNHPSSRPKTFTVLQAGNPTPYNLTLYTNIYSYWANIYIGTPPVSLTVDVDTGSSTLAVPSVGCQFCNSSTLYNPSTSNTALPLSCTDSQCVATILNPQCTDPSQPYCTYQLGYGDQSTLSGFLVTDQVTFGGLTTGAMFGDIQYESLDFTTESYGIVGLAQASKDMICTPSCVKPLFDTYVSALDVPNSFSLSLTVDGGWLDLGGYQSTGFMSWADNQLDTYYGIHLDQLSLGDANVSLTVPLFDDNRMFIVDSGTSLLLLDPFVFSQLQNLFTGLCPQYAANSSFYILFCGWDNTMFTGGYSPMPLPLDLQGLPPLIVTIARAGAFPIPPELYLLWSDDINLSGVYSGPGYIFGVAALPGLGLGGWSILGDVFLRSVDSVVFDRYYQQIGFNSTNGNHNSISRWRVWQYVVYGLSVGVLLIALLVLLGVLVGLHRRRRRRCAGAAPHCSDPYSPPLLPPGKADPNAGYGYGYGQPAAPNAGYGHGYGQPAPNAGYGYGFGQPYAPAPNAPNGPNGGGYGYGQP